MLQNDVLFLQQVDNHRPLYLFNYMFVSARTIIFKLNDLCLADSNSHLTFSTH